MKWGLPNTLEPIIETELKFKKYMITDEEVN